MLMYRLDVPVVSYIDRNFLKNKVCQPASDLTNSGKLVMRNHVPIPEVHNSH